MLQTLTDTAAIRTFAAQSAEGMDGAVTDRQIDRSRELAYLFMIEIVTESIYEAVRSYNGADADLLKKKDRFQRAECCIALHCLPGVLSNQRLTKDGIKRSLEMSNGKYRTDYASQDESRTFGQDWLRLAYSWLSPYLSNEILDEDNEQVGVRTNDGGFVIMGI